MSLLIMKRAKEESDDSKDLQFPHLIEVWVDGGIKHTQTLSGEVDLCPV